MPPPIAAAAAHDVAYRPVRTPDDVPFLYAVYASTRAEEVAAAGWPEEAQRAFLAQQADAQHRHYVHHYPDAEWLVIQRGGQPVGRLYLEEWKDQIRIIDIALLPEARGSGIGGAILTDMCGLARSRNKRLSIHVEKNNPAMRLYCRLGFARVEDKGVYDLMEWDPGG
ncbi:MAG: GNAT family N-acetyltransferase [Allosphingosinicella sp.]|uniref:GNAT family N-acetyltransferase n=1 Tax=Allosphingosinicella sp. TaxID=2823234 RepID=UPI0039551988